TGPHGGVDLQHRGRAFRRVNRGWVSKEGLAIAPGFIPFIFWEPAIKHGRRIAVATFTGIAAWLLLRFPT
ncbi:MAG: hypothetical protein ACOC3W_05940, partial [Thermodesulfobacteriota bacterium]